mmetsp:Transcript_19116/g.20582  ORF Transcript_19116/g.20582 Transcript_19116/m.20582 type:complete len:508 (+) Transcript_19116:178-1701(+)
MNIPTNPELEPIPDQAKGNPVYEQTRQDMPLWCCGRNCGRNSRIVVFVLGMIGIACSSFVCLSSNYFSFVSLRNDTFYDKDKQQPKPFEYATEANVGLFRYEILGLYEYPWPPKEQRDLFDAIHERELERLDRINADGIKEQDGVDSTTTSSIAAAGFFNRLLYNKFPDDFYDDDFSNDDYNDNDNDNDNDSDNVSNPSQNNITQHQNDTTSIILTKAPSDTPPRSNGDILVSDIPDVLPGSNAIVRLPTTSPTPSPTRTNPNDLIDVEIGVVKSYPVGVDFDSLFTNGQKGAMWAPILATIGLIFSLVEFCCCKYKCSWLPTALCLYGAFMLQLMTMFLFMSEDFCKYDQDCVLGFSGFLSAIAVIAYMISQMLVCMTPRPPPLYDLCKKPPVKRKKKKKKIPDEFDEKWGLVDDDNDNDNDNNEDGFVNEPNGYVEPYDDDYYQEEPYDTSNDEYNDYNDYEYNDNHRSDNQDQEPYGEATDEYEGEDDHDYDHQENMGTDTQKK